MHNKSGFLAAADTLQFIYIRSSFDWNGRTGVELSLNGNDPGVFACSYKTAYKDLVQWLSTAVPGEEFEAFSKAVKIPVIQPAMTESEKLELDESLTEWARKI